MENKKFLPSKDLAKEYDRILENKLREKESERDICLARKNLREYAEFMGGEEVSSEKDSLEFIREGLGGKLISNVIGYTHRKSETSENLGGLVVKLTENNSFNSEFIERFGRYGGVDSSDSKFFCNLHGEFRNYLKQNSMKLSYAKIRVSEKDEIEFYDFVKKKFPSPDEILNDDKWILI
jgi:hypothetical protein